MTGKSYSKTRVFLSDRFTSPISRKSLEDAALDFRRALNSSSLRPHLNADLAVKAFPGAQSRGNTDGKKRTNNGSIPGVENFNGYRYDPKQKGGPGKVFKPFVRYSERINPREQKPNWGWIDEISTQEVRESNASIRIRRYDVNKRTGEVVESSEEELNTLTASGLPLDMGIQEKRLPGQTIGEKFRGGSLVARSARAVGVLTDADGKLRCPPGTPAANQFTDSVGSNCFGFSASEIVGMAQRVAGFFDAADNFNSISEANAESGLSSGAQAPLSNNARGWAKLIGERVKTAGRLMWQDRQGRDRQPSEWEVEELPEHFTWFKNGAKRGRKSLRDMHDRTKSIKEKLGIPESAPPDRAWDKNWDLAETFEEMRRKRIVTTQFVGRPQTEEEVARLCIRNLAKNSSWKNLSDEDKAAYLKLEMQNYFTAERAMLEQILKSYSEMPEHMRTIDAVRWNKDLPFKSEAMASWNFADGVFGGESSLIDISIPQIIYNATKMLPPLDEYQRARIDALGGGSDAENATELNDFLVSAYASSKETAAMVGGLESFARHIMAHEISHTTQFTAITNMVKRQLNSDGSFTLPNGRRVTSWNDITNQEWQEVMNLIKNDPKWLVDNVRELDDVIRRADAAQWLAGKYIWTEYPEGSNPIVRALEITAELAALREQGIIHGQAVDDALAFMDSHVDRRFNEERGVSDVEETARFLDLMDAVESGQVSLNTSPELQARIDADNELAEKRVRKEAIQDDIANLEELSDDDLVDEIAAREFELEKARDIADANPRDLDAAREVENLKQELSRAKKVWKDKTGLSEEPLNKLTKIRRDELDLLPKKELDARSKRRELEKIQDDASRSTPEELISRLAYVETQLARKDISPEMRKKLNEAKKIYRDEYRKKYRDSGEDISTQKINREIDKLVDERINPPKEKKAPIAEENTEAPKTKTRKPKPVKQPKNKAATTKHANTEREALFNESTPKEMSAIMELSDPSDKDIALLLDPEKRDGAIDRIRNKHDALVEQNVETDPNSLYEGSLEQQIENVLLPTLDLIEKSELQSSVEIEATIELTDDQLDGIDVNPINIDTLISGKLITGQDGPASSNPRNVNPDTGKTPHKVIIQVEDGQKGYYPHWSDDSEKEPGAYKQKLVIPPGELEIVDTIENKDGTKTLVARIKRQKSTEEILNGVLDSADSESIPPGARHDIEKAINKHILSRRERGLHSDQITPKDVKEEIDDRNSGSLDAVNNDGGSFGESLDGKTVELINNDIDAPGEAESEVFGPIQTAQERRRLRSEELAEITQRLKEIFESGEADEELGISAEDIDPEILKILTESTPQELEEILADEAENIHNEIDKRPRVVVDEEDLDDIVEEAQQEASTGTKTPNWWETTPKPGSGTSNPRIRPIPEYAPIPRPQQEERKPEVPAGRPKKLKRDKATSAIERVLDAAKRARNNYTGRLDSDPRGTAEAELFRIQEKIDRANYRNYSGAAYDVQKVLNEKFGTTNLSELTDEQISEAIDALKDKASNLSDSRSTRAGEIEANKKQSIDRIAGELLDYIDIRKMRDNNDYRDPYGTDNPSNWSIDPSAFDFDRPRPFRASGLSSGSQKKIGTVTDGPVEKVTVKRQEGSIDSPTSYRPWMGVEVDADVHQIGDEKVYFGSDKIDDESIKVLPINPYEISGFSSDSEEGQKAALLWFSATVGSMSEPNRDGGKTSALLYAASRGDSDAQAELERLAKVGDEKMKETLEDYKTFMERFDGTTREEREADGGKWWQYNYGDAMVNYTNMETYERVSRPFELKDINMVHQTSFEPTIDADGNLVLKPAEDFDYVDPVTGEVALNPETGEPYEIYRGSVHFSLNHLVEGHIYRPTPRTGTWAVIIPAQSMIESNPGSLENLYAVDTFLTPPPGQGLKIPAGQFKIVKLPAVDVDKNDPGYTDAALAAEKRSQEIVNAALQEIGVEQTGDKFYKTPIFSPGMHGSSAGVDKRMRDLASDQGVSSTKHEGHPGAMLEQISRISNNRGVDSFADGYMPMGYMSRNGRLRVANNNRFSNSKEKELEQDNFLAGDSGLFSGKESGKLGRGMSARAARVIVGKILDSRDDIDDDTKEKLLLTSEVVASFAAKGPQGALTQLAIEAARRGGREVAEIAVQKLLDSGKITPEQARIAMQSVDRVAPNGLPDPLKEKLIDGFEAVDEFIGERVLTDENKQRVLDATEAAREKAGELSSQARESVGDAAKKAKEKSRDVIGRLKRKKQSVAELPSVDDVIYDTFATPDPDDPFASPPSPATAVPAPTIGSIFDDPFGVPSVNTPEEEPEERISGRQRLLRRVSERRNAPAARRQEDEYTPEFDPNDPFTGGLASGRSTGEQNLPEPSGLSSGRRGRKLEKAGRPESGQDFGNSTNAFDYMPTSEDQVADIIDSNPFSRKAKRGGSKKILKAIEKAGIDWDKQRKLQDTLQKTIDESPQIRRFIEEFGMPPVFALDEMPSNGFLDTGGAWVGAAGVYLPEIGIIAMPSSSRSSGRLKDDFVLRHELTHAFHFMARARSERARDLMAEKYQQMTEEVKRLSKERGISPQGIIDAASYDRDVEAMNAISGLTPEEREEALKISSYAATNMLEFIAEAIASASSPNSSDRAKVSERALEMIAPFLGMSILELKGMLSR